VGKLWFRNFTQSWYTTVDGKKVNLGKDKRKAEAAWHKIESGGQTPTTVRLKNAFDLYLASLGECTADTRDVAQRHLASFLAFVGNVQVQKLKPLVWTEYLKTKSWSESTKRTALNKILAALNYAVDQGAITGHPFKIKQKPRMERRMMVIRVEDQTIFEDAAYPALRAFLRGLRESGMRPSEVATARIEHCDLEKGILLVPNKVRKKTGEHYRPIFLSGSLKELIRELIGKRTEGNIWLNSFGKPWNPRTLPSLMRRLRIKAGANGTLYEYRHFYASNAINAGNVNPAHVARLLGHKDLRMVMQTYLHDDVDALRGAAEKASLPPVKIPETNVPET
jgi:integrase